MGFIRPCDRARTRNVLPPVRCRIPTVCGVRSLSLRVSVDDGRAGVTCCTDVRLLIYTQDGQCAHPGSERDVAAVQQRGGGMGASQVSAGGPQIRQWMPGVGRRVLFRVQDKAQNISNISLLTPLHRRSAPSPARPVSVTLPFPRRDRCSALLQPDGSTVPMNKAKLDEMIALVTSMAKRVGLLGLWVQRGKEEIR